MKMKVLKECGYDEALIGVGLSYSVVDKVEDTQELAHKLKSVLIRLSSMDGGHNKFLEQIQVWLDVTAPRYWWAEADTYRVGTSKQSDSTMHTLYKKPFTQDMFEQPIPSDWLRFLEKLRTEKYGLEAVKNLLPEGFLQRRIWNVNYKVLRNILSQRKNHKLVQWQNFCRDIYANVKHPEFFADIMVMHGSSGEGLGYGVVPVAGKVGEIS